MALILSDLQELNVGFRNPIRVGEIRFDTATKLDLRNHGAYLSKPSLDHIFDRHKDVTYFDLLCLPMAITNGLIVQENAKKHVILCSYQNLATGLRYIASMKVISDRTEVWVTSFYRSDKGQTKALLKRGTIIQNHR